MLNKTIQLLNSTTQLAAGDVVLFRSVYHKNLGQTLISYYQSFTTNKHGHYETVHAGICVGHDKKGPIVAHVTGGKIFGYALQHLSDINTEDKENRPLLVYRHQDKLIRELIANKAANIANKKQKPQWTFATALKLLFTNSNNMIKPGEISLSTVCSKFTIEILQQVTKNSASYLRMHPTSTPKALEAELFNNPYYDLLIYTGSPDPTSNQGLDPYLTLKNTVETELNRLGQQKKNNKWIEHKYLQVKAALFRSTEFAEKEQDVLYKAQHLLQEVMPELEKHTGYGFRKPTSYQNVAQQARKLGIFRWEKPVIKTNSTVVTAHSVSLR